MRPKRRAGHGDLRLARPERGDETYEAVGTVVAGMGGRAPWVAVVAGTGIRRPRPEDPFLARFGSAMELYRDANPRSEGGFYGPRSSPSFKIEFKVFRTSELFLASSR